jgi:hypothetical protein
MGFSRYSGVGDIVSHMYPDLSDMLRTAISILSHGSVPGLKDEILSAQETRYHNTGACRPGIRALQNSRGIVGEPGYRKGRNSWLSTTMEGETANATITLRDRVSIPSWPERSIPGRMERENGLTAGYENHRSDFRLCEAFSGWHDDTGIF